MYLYDFRTSRRFNYLWHRNHFKRSEPINSRHWTIPLNIAADYCSIKEADWFVAHLLSNEPPLASTGTNDGNPPADPATIPDMIWIDPAKVTSRCHPAFNLVSVQINRHHINENWQLTRFIYSVASTRPLIPSWFPSNLPDAIDQYARVYLYLQKLIHPSDSQQLIHTFPTNQQARI